MSIDDLTIGQVKHLTTLLGGKTSGDNSHWKIGSNYLIRTVTMIQVGRLELVTEKELVLSSAAWIADTGRFYNALRDGTLSEIEPFPNDIIVGRGSIIDATEWTHELPKEQK